MTDSKLSDSRQWLIGRLPIPGGVVLLVVGKLYYVHTQFAEPLVARFFWQAFTVLALCAFVLTTLHFSSRWGNVMAVALDATISILLWGDLLYYRLFNDWPSISSLVAAHQLASSPQSIWHSAQVSDLWLLADLPLFLLLSFLIPAPNRPKSMALRLVPWLAAGSIMVGSLAVVGFSVVLPQSFPIRHDNSELVSYHGLLLFHCYDALCYSSSFLRPHWALSTKETLPVFRAARNRTGQSLQWFGAHKDANLVIIQLESFESFPIGLKIQGQDVTPILNELTETSLWAHAHDQTLQGSSSDGEFIYLNSLHPPSFGPLVYQYPDIDYLALPKILAGHGYVTQSVMPFNPRFWNKEVMDRAYHFQERLYDDAFAIPKSEILDWGLKDSPLFSQYLPLLPEKKQPFLSYLVTLMMHHPFPELPVKAQILTLPSDLEGTAMGRYLQLAAARDKAIGELIEGLQARQLWDNTILVLCGDHRSRMSAREKSRLSLPTHPRVLLLIRCPGGVPSGRVEDPVGQMDLMPTLLHLLGISSEEALFLGTNLLNENRGPVVAGDWVFGDKGAMRVGQASTGARAKPEEWLQHHRLQRGASDSVIYRDSIGETLELLNR